MVVAANTVVISVMMTNLGNLLLLRCRPLLTEFSVPPRFLAFRAALNADAELC